MRASSYFYSSLDIWSHVDSDLSIKSTILSSTSCPIFGLTRKWASSYPIVSFKADFISCKVFDSSFKSFSATLSIFCSNVLLVKPFFFFPDEPWFSPVALFHLSICGFSFRLSLSKRTCGSLSVSFICSIFFWITFRAAVSSHRPVGSIWLFGSSSNTYSSQSIFGFCLFPWF